MKPSALQLAEYESLRHESVTRVVLGQSMVALALVSFGALATVGLTDVHDTRFVMAATPVILLFISLAWARNGQAGRRCAEYLRSIERKFPEIGWESDGVRADFKMPGGPAVRWLVDYSGQLLFIVLGWSAASMFAIQIENNVADFLALAVAAAAGVIMTFVMLIFGPISPLVGSKAEGTGSPTASGRPHLPPLGR